MSIYRPLLDSLSQFFRSLTDIIDFFSSAYDNVIITDDFNTQPLDSAMSYFIKVNGLINLVKRSTCLKGQSSYIDVILTNMTFLFKHANSYEASISDHHYLIYSML